MRFYDTEDVAPKLLLLLKEGTVVVSIQNGVENEEILAKYVGENGVLEAYIKELGVVVHEAACLLEIWRDE
jgi:2-dehydropantoate 2-reductase